MTKLSPAIIRSNEQIAPGAYILAFEREFEFIPGQVIGLTHDVDVEPRLYSIASGNEHPQVHILYTVKPDGFLTPGLAAMKPGKKVFYTLPFGKFTGNEKPAVWIATGTGIAPFASMMFSGLAVNKTLIYGHRYPERLFFHRQIRDIIGDRYVPCCTRKKVEGIFYGRVTDYIRSQDTLDPTIPYYLCGNSEMVVDMRDLLIEKGIPYEKIIAEIFF
ncbi:MAG: hypothetical protein R6U64_03965 [Bacteroidales bacterium]